MTEKKHVIVVREGENPYYYAIQSILHKTNEIKTYKKPKKYFHI